MNLMIHRLYADILQDYNSLNLNQALHLLEVYQVLPLHFDNELFYIMTDHFSLTLQSIRHNKTNNIY